ncbi:Na+/H+ antiporter subunit D [Halobacteriales archaeon QS_8_69_26]|nr:MAG: Na+/H+ antiporter subunit D [Halobacteriales archaeon QS_8_69_26]
MAALVAGLVVAVAGSLAYSLVIAPLLVALATAVVTLLARPWPRLGRALSVLGAGGYAIAVAALVEAVLLPLSSDPAVLTYQVSDWNAPFGITAVADPLSAFMLALAAVVVVPALVFSVLYVDEHGQALSYHPLFHFMLVGVSGSFLTGDLFNLFVWFEVMLMSSYVLVVFYSGPQHTRAALQYVVLNLVGSGVMLVAIGGLYSTTGTLNMADMARRLADPGAFGVDPAPVLGLSAVLFAVFALKAGVVPFQFWVPAAYRAAPAPVAAVLAGVVKKVGIYAVIRLYFTVFAAATIDVSLPGIAGDSVLAFYGPVLFAMAAGSILLGGVGAVARDDFEEMLAFSSIGQVGFIVLPLAMAASVAVPVAGPFASVRSLGIAAALVYSLNHAVAKGTLFMAAGATWSATGTVDLDRLGGLSESAPVLSGSVFVAGIALVGVPPVVGFFGKFLVFDAAFRSGSWLAVAVALGGAVLTIAYVTRLWNRGFWGDPGEAVGEVPPRGQVAVVGLLAAALLAIGIGFDPVFRAAGAAAEAALDRGEYIEAVEPRRYSGDGGEDHATLLLVAATGGGTARRRVRAALGRVRTTFDGAPSAVVGGSTYDTDGGSTPDHDEGSDADREVVDR